jgi:hypothetical protein
MGVLESTRLIDRKTVSIYASLSDVTCIKLDNDGDEDTLPFDYIAYLLWLRDQGMYLYLKSHSSISVQQRCDPITSQNLNWVWG